MIATYRLAALTLLLCLPLVSHAQNTPSTQKQKAQTIHFVCTGKPHEAGYQFAEKIYRRAFAKLGYRFVMRHATNDEAVKLIRNESVDGDCGRVTHFKELSGLRNTLSIPHAYRMAEFSAWRNTNHKLPQNRKDIRIGYNNNALFIPYYLKDMGYRQSKGYPSTDAMLKALSEGHIDLIMHYHTGMDKLTFPPYDKTVTYHNHILSIPIHGLLLKKHEHLINPLSDIIARQTSISPFRHNDNEIAKPNDDLKTLYFSCSVPDGNHYFKIINNKLNQAFNVMGYHIDMKSLSRGREIAEFKKGNIDGSCGRTKMFADEIKEYAINLDIPVTTSRFQVWSTKPNPQINQLKDFPYGSKIAVVRGTVSINQKLKGSELLVTQVSSAKTGLQKLANGEVDYYIDILQSAGPQLEQLKSQVPIYQIGGIQGSQIYPLLHIKHKYLQQQATELLRLHLRKTGHPHLTHH